MGRRKVAEAADHGRVVPTEVVAMRDASRDEDVAARVANGRAGCLSALVERNPRPESEQTRVHFYFGQTVDNAGLEERPAYTEASR